MKAVVSICEHFSKQHKNTVLNVSSEENWKDCLCRVLGDSYLERINDLSSVIEEAQMELWHSTRITFDVSFIE